MYDFVLLLTGSAQQWSGFPNEVASQQAVDQLSSNSVTFDLNFPVIWSHSWHNPMNLGMDYNTPALQCIAAWLCKFTHTMAVAACYWIEGEMCESCKRDFAFDQTTGYTCYYSVCQSPLQLSAVHCTHFCRQKAIAFRAQIKDDNNIQWCEIQR